MRVGDYLDDSRGEGRNSRHRKWNVACAKRVLGLVPGLWIFLNTVA